MTTDGSAIVVAHTQTWNYNAKAEVISDHHSSHDAFDRAYEFDSIGNPIQSADVLNLAAPSANSHIIH